MGVPTLKTLASAALQAALLQSVGKAEQVFQSEPEEQFEMDMDMEGEGLVRTSMTSSFTSTSSLKASVSYASSSSSSDAAPIAIHKHLASLGKSDTARLSSSAPHTSFATRCNTAPAAAAKGCYDDGASDDFDTTCGICFDATGCLEVRGCGHRLCAGCAKSMCKQLVETRKPLACAFCRGVVKGFDRAGDH